VGVFSSHLLCGCVHGPLSYCDISVEYEAVASEPTEKWGGVVRRAKGRGLGRGYASWGSGGLPHKNFVKK